MLFCAHARARVNGTTNGFFGGKTVVKFIICVTPKRSLRGAGRARARAFSLPTLATCALSVATKLTFSMGVQVVGPDS